MCWFLLKYNKVVFKWLKMALCVYMIYGFIYIYEIDDQYAELQ